MSTESSNETSHDPFDDSDTGSDAGTTTESNAGQDTQEGGTGGKAAEGGSDDKTGVKSAAGTPPEDDEDDESVLDDKGQKFIPEHRFKAALKSATERAEKAETELKQFTTPTIEIPDKETDPEGHQRHIRMEASVEVMREMKSDYQEVINHYATLAESNPLLNQAVENHAIPAKLAYDIAKRDLEIKKVDEVLQSGDWEKFQAWKATQVDPATTAQTEQTKTVTSRLKAVPNLNRSTNASPNRNVRKGDTADDDLFKGAL